MLKRCQEKSAWKRKIVGRRLARSENGRGLDSDFRLILRGLSQHHFFSVRESGGLQGSPRWRMSNPGSNGQATARERPRPLYFLRGHLTCNGVPLGRLPPYARPPAPSRPCPTLCMDHPGVPSPYPRHLIPLSEGCANMHRPSLLIWLSSPK